MKWKTFFTVLALVLFFSVPFLYSLDPAEMTTQEILSELIQLYNERLTDLTESEQALSEKEIALNERETVYQQSVTDLLNRESDLTERENYYKNLISALEQKARDEYRRGLIHGGIGGSIVGGVGGGLLTFKLSN